MIKKLFFILIYCTLGSIFLIQPVDAAEMIFQSPQNSYGLLSEISVDVLLDPQDVSINAVEAVIDFDPDNFEFQQAQDNDSIINYWLTRPHLISDGKIEFSGVIPGGFQGILSSSYSGGRPGKIFTLYFKAKKSGLSEITAEKITVLQNDGLGSTATARSEAIRFNISSTTGSAVIIRDEDKNPPEEFQPIVSRSPLLFKGKWFVAFNADDRQTGINHYEIQESRSSMPKDTWELASSPYQLTDQTLSSYIYIKAVDNAGNENIQTIQPARALSTLLMVGQALFILTALFFLGLFIWRKYNEKKSHNLTLAVFIGLLFFFFSPINLHAATLLLSPSSGAYQIGDTISVSVLVNSPDKSMNAVSATISFPRNLLEAISISKTGSILTLWAQEPSISNTNGTVDFEGVALNPGFIGSAGKVITMFFKVKSVGTVDLSFSSASVLANDGKGTNILDSLGRGAYDIKNPPVSPRLPTSSSTPTTSSSTILPLPLNTPTETPFTLFIREATRLLTMITPLVALIILLLLIFYAGLTRYKLLKSKMRVSSLEAEIASDKAFRLLRDTVSEQIGILEKTQSMRKLTTEEIQFLKQLKEDLTQASLYVRKEIEDIEKLK